MSADDEPMRWRDVPQSKSSGLIELVARFHKLRKLTNEVRAAIMGDSLDDKTRDMAAEQLQRFADEFGAMAAVVRDRDATRWTADDDEALRDLT